MPKSLEYSTAFFETLREGSLHSAQEIVPIVLKLLQAKSVVDVGCGTGEFLRVFREYGIQDVLGIDGEYVDQDQLAIPRENFLALDVSAPFSLDKTFDLALCLEVAEHLPPESALRFVESLTCLAPIILFSAAIPLQGGTHHINEQWPVYWAHLFKTKGFVPVDAVRKRIWDNSQVDWWYRQNIMFFCNEQALRVNPKIEQDFHTTNISMLCVVHPELYISKNEGHIKRNVQNLDALRSIERRIEEVPSIESETWLADVAVYPAGEKRVLMQARSTGATSLVHATYAELLTHCREFKTLDEHLYAFCYGKHLNGMMLSKEIVQGLRRKFQQFAQEGYLIPQSQLRAIFQEAGEPAVPTRITSIGIPTCDRVDTLQGSLSSYLEHCQHFGRSLEFVVMDDSSSASTREAYRQMLRGLQQRYGMSIAYAGREEKMAYVRQLSKAGKIPEGIVSWACLGGQVHGESTLGANRNALLLHTVGECLFLSDDDLICRIAASPGYQEGLALHSQGNPCQYWYYPDREHALEATPLVEQDFLALHEQWLGQDPRAAGAPYSQAGQISIERAEPGFLHRFVTQPGKVAMALHGIVGDASFRTIDYLFSHPEESLKRQMRSEEAYRSACTSREWAQVVHQLTLTANPESLLGACLGGVDNRELLPPFTHIGWVEDFSFGAMLATCFPNAYTVYLPWTLLHMPPETRPYIEPICNIGGYISREVPFYSWLPKCIALFHPAQISTPADHLSQLGQYLEHIGRLPLPAFEDFARQLLWRLDGGHIASLEQRLHKDGLLPSWKQDVEAYCARARECMMLPIEQRLQGGGEMAQRALLQFAQILHWWPAMVETARKLRAEGYRVAQPL